MGTKNIRKQLEEWEHKESVVSTSRGVRYTLPYSMDICFLSKKIDFLVELFERRIDELEEKMDELLEVVKKCQK